MKKWTKKMLDNFFNHFELEKYEGQRKKSKAKGKFHVHGSFGIKNYRQFIFTGILKIGELKKGMLMNMDINQVLSLKIGVSEILDFDITGNQTSTSALLVYCRDEEEYEFLKALQVKNKEIILSS